MKRYFVTGWRESLTTPRLLLETADPDHAERSLRWHQRAALGLTHYRILDHEPTERDCPPLPARIHRVHKAQT